MQFSLFLKKKPSEINFFAISLYVMWQVIHVIWGLININMNTVQLLVKTHLKSASSKSQWTQVSTFPLKNPSCSYWHKVAAHFDQIPIRETGSRQSQSSSVEPESLHFPRNICL